MLQSKFQLGEEVYTLQPQKSRVAAGSIGSIPDEPQMLWCIRVKLK